MQHPVGAPRARAAVALLIALCVGSGGCDDTAERAALAERATSARSAGDLAGEIDALHRLGRRAPDDPQTRYRLARAYWEAGSHQEAQREIQAALRLAPDHLEARILAARRLSIGPPEERARALEMLRSLTEEHPEHAGAWSALARAARRNGDTDEALVAARRALELAPEDPAAQLYLARTHALRGEFAAAGPLLRRRCEERPGSACYGELARLIARDPSRHAEALALLETARGRVPFEERADTYALAADILLQGGRLLEAEDMLRVGIGSEAGSLHLLFQLARVQAARGSRSDADRTIDEVSLVKPYDPSTHFEMSRFLEEQGDLQRALDAADRAVNLAPEDRRLGLHQSALRLERSQLRGEARGPVEAERTASAALEENPFDSDALLLQARLELARERAAEAADAASRALDLRPESATAHRLRALARRSLGDFAGARQDARHALRLAPTRLDTERLLTRLAVDLGDDAGALAGARRVLERAPGDDAMRILLVRTLRRSGQLAEARRTLEEVPRELRSAALHLELGRLRIAAGQLVRARESLTRAALLEPENPEVLGALLEIDRSEGRLGESGRRIRKAGRENPEDARLVALLARVARYEGDPVRAEALMERARQLDPEVGATPGP